MFAFMVIGLNGRIPLNTAGNLAAQVAGYTPNDTGDWSAYGLGTALTVYGGNGTCIAPGELGQRGRPDVRLQNGFMSPQNTPASVDRR